MEPRAATEDRIEELLGPLRADPGSAAILCDVDGTLAPIVLVPEHAAVPDEARALLGALAERYAVVACVSGRRALEARRVTGLDQIAYAGNHGFELLPADAAEPVLHPALAGHEHDAQRFAERLDRAQLDRAELRTEDKGAIVALHWRGAGDEAVAEALAERIASNAEAAGLRPHRGRKVIELRPGIAINKADAVRGLLAGHDVKAALYAGDDRTDVDAFRSLRALEPEVGLRSVCVGIGSPEGPPEVAREADLIVDGLDGFVHVLRYLAGSEGGA